jgi:DNA-binding MarR family transcriptional regulator
VLYPSQERIAKDLRMDARHVRRCLDVLEKYGLIEISHR